MVTGEKPRFAGAALMNSCKTLILNNFILLNFSSFCHSPHLARPGETYIATCSQSYPQVLWVKTYILGQKPNRPVGPGKPAALSR